MNFDYYYGDESNQFAFYRIPRQLITGEAFKKLSTDAKLLYGLLLDRMGLSAKNGWYDDMGRVFIYYTLDEIQEDLNCGHEKAVRLLAELDTGKKGFGLIERVKQGQGRPTKIYCVILKGRDRDSPTGDIRSFDFSAHLHRLEHTAVEAKAVELVFYSGRRFSMEPERYRAAMEDLFWEYGTLRRIRYLPENEAALVRTIMMEHRYQKGWMPKKDRAPPSGPVR